MTGDEKSREIWSKEAVDPLTIYDSKPTPGENDVDSGVYFPPKE